MAEDIDRTWMKKSCELCPFSRVNTLFLSPERAEEFASMAENPFNDFPCHKTADLHEDHEGGMSGYVHGKNSFTCHGFKAMQVEACMTEEEVKESGFVSDGNCFSDFWDMVETHERLFEENGR